MSKREQIILVFVILAALYAGYNFLGTSNKDANIKTEEQLTDLKNLVADITAQTSKVALSDTETLLIKRAEAGWKRDPFLSSGVPVKFSSDGGPSEVSTQASGFSYAGYLETNDKKLAIINGMEYESGDMLDGGGFIVRSISPTQVEIGAIGGKEMIVLPLKEVSLLSLDKTE